MSEILSVPESISKIEAITGVALPPDYRAWLLAGADDPYPLPAEVSIPDGDSPWIDEISVLYGAPDILELMEFESMLWEDDLREFPKGTIPIGCNQMGDSFLLSLREPDTGSIYFLFHETMDPENDDWAGIHVVGRSFTSWLAGLVKLEREEPEPDDPVKRIAGYQEIIRKSRKPWWRFW